VVKATLRAEEGADAALQQLVRFRRWLRPRLPAVEHLQLSMWTPLTHTAPVALLDELLAGSGAGLPHQPPLPLARLTIPWLGAVDFHLSTLAHLPALRSVAFYDTRLRVFGGPLAPGEQAAQQGGPLPSQPPLTDFTVDGGQLHFDVQVQGGWLPLSVTALRLTECQLRDLPRGLLSSLTNLRRQGGQEGVQRGGKPAWPLSLFLLPVHACRASRLCGDALPPAPEVPPAA
jgi:hypothetical protein